MLGPDVWLPKDCFIGGLLLDVILCSGDCQAWEDTRIGVGANLLLLSGAGVWVFAFHYRAVVVTVERQCSREHVCSNLTICINECRASVMKGYSKAPGSYLHQSAHTTTIIEVFFAHLLI